MKKQIKLADLKNTQKFADALLRAIDNDLAYFDVNGLIFEIRRII